jgi:multiple sugar transport system permease protein
MLKRKRFIFAILAILPTLAIFAYVRLYPIADTLRLSLFKWDILSKNKPFIGLANFRELTGDHLFLDALVNTTIIAFGVLFVTIPMALVIAALIFHRTRSRMAGFYETAVFISSRWCRLQWPGSGFSTHGSGRSMRF